MVAKKHDWKLVYHNQETGDDEIHVFVDITTQKFQMELGKLVNEGKIPKGILWPGGTGELYKDGEKVGFDEAKIALIRDYRDAGYGYEEIAKTLKMPVSAVRAACG
jgi:hypothetical protein